MQERGSGYHTGKYAFHYVDPDTRLEIAERPVGKDQADVNSNQRSTAPDHETHKPTNRAVCLNPFTIVDPNQREVLDSVKHFKQYHATPHTFIEIVATH